MKLNAINIAPNARRHPPLVWLALCASAIALALSLGYCWMTYSAYLSSVHDRSIKRIELRKKQDEMRRQQIEESSQAALEKAKLRANMTSILKMSWDGLFDVLEVNAKAVDAGVTIISMSPVSKAGEHVREVNINAIAANAAIMLAYLKNLKADKRVYKAEISSTQPEEKVSPGAIRFQYSLALQEAQ